MKRLAVTIALALAGCGGSNAFSCASNGGAVCVEIDNPPGGTAQQEQQSCTQNMGTYSNGPCTRTGALGGCENTFQGVSFSSTTWYYMSAQVKTIADVKTLCMQQMATFVSP